MQIATIAEYTGVKPSHVRQFCAEHEIPRQRRHGYKGVFVDVDAYIKALRQRGYDVEADRLDLRRRAT